ncbi:MAG: alanyl-tRNA editing protein [Anaerovoracaceae bacterium]
MGTKKLYPNNMYLKEWEAKVTNIIRDSKEIADLGGLATDENPIAIVLDQTAFFPEGGGQPSDTGHIGTIPISHVFEKDGVIYHQSRGEKLPTQDLLHQTLPCTIDWAGRFRNMQRHCGEHILSAAFYELYGGVNRGFHMGEDYMTVDIALEENPNYTSFTDEMIKAVEWRSNEYIWNDEPVTIYHFESKEEAALHPMRKALTLDEDITLVCVGNESNAAGCVACCGTHPTTCGQVGLIKIYRWESYKGMTRIYFDAGQDALKNYIQIDEIIKTLGRNYSADKDSLLKKIQLQDNKFKEVRQNLYEFKKAFTEERLKELLKETGENKASVTVKEYPLLKTDDILIMMRGIPDNLHGLLALISPSENTVLLHCNGHVDCGKLIKDNAHIWKGKGGGKAQSARAMFPERQYLDCFIDFIKQAF